MSNWFKKLVSLFLTVCLLLTSIAALAEEQEPEAASETVNEAAEILLPAQEEIAVPEESVQEEPAAEEPAEPAAEEPATEVAAQEETITEEPVQENRAEEIVAEHAVEEPAQAEEAVETAVEPEAATEPVEETVVAEPTEQAEPAGDDAAGTVSEIITFMKGFAQILRETALYADRNSEKKIAVLETGIVEVMDRINVGMAGDQVLVSFELNNETVSGFISMEDVRPCTEEEVAGWLQSGEKVKGFLIEENAVAEIAAETAAEEETIAKETVAEVVAEEKVSQEAPAVVEIEQVEMVPEEEVVAEELIPEESVEEPVVEEPVVEVIAEEKASQEVPAAIEIEQVEMVPEEENAAEEPVAEKLVEETSVTEASAEDEVDLEAALSSIPDSIRLTIGAQPAYDRVMDFPIARNWELTLPEAGRLSIYVNPEVDPGHTGTISITVWNDEVNKILVPVTSGSSAFVMEDIWLDAGNYNIVAEGPGYEVLYSMRVTFNPATGAISGYKSYDTPYTLASSNAFTRGVFTIQDKDDYFLYAVSAPSYVSIVTRVYEPNVMVLLYDASDMTLGTSWILLGGSETSPKIEEHVEWLEAGRYYIRVVSANTGIYDIYAQATAVGDVDREPNDGRGTALPISIGTTYQGMISMLDGSDFYELNVTVPTEVGISVQETMNGVDVKLFDKNMTPTPLVTMNSTYPSGSSPTKPVETYALYRLEPNQSYFLQVKRNHSLAAGAPDNGTGLYWVTVTRKLTVESVSVSPTIGGYGTVFTVTPTVGGGTPVVAQYELYKYMGGSNPWQLYWSERTLSPVWELRSLGDTAAQIATWGGTWKVIYRVYDGYSWTSMGETQPFLIGMGPSITNISVGVTSPNTVYVGVDFNVSVTTAATGTTPTLYVYDIIDSNNSLLADKRQITTSPTTKMHVDGAGTGYHVMVSVFDAYGKTDVKHSTAYQPAFDAVSKLTIDSLTLKANGMQLIATLATSNGTPVNTKYDIYCNDALIDSKTVVGGNNFTYNAPSGGKYYMVASCYNGSIWLTKTVSSNVVSVAEAFEVYSVDPNVTTAMKGSSVTFTASYTGTILKTKYYLNWVTGGNSYNIDYWEGSGPSHAFTLPAPGSYAVYAIITDGFVEKHVASGWVTVSLAGATVVSVTTDKKIATVGETIKATVVTAGDATVKTDWYLVDSLGNVVKSWTGNSHTYSFKAPAADTYTVVCAVFGYYGDSGDFKGSDPFNVI